MTRQWQWQGYIYVSADNKTWADAAAQCDGTFWLIHTAANEESFSGKLWELRSFIWPRGEIFTTHTSDYVTKLLLGFPLLVIQPHKRYMKGWITHSPLLVGEQLVSLQPGGDSGVMRQVVLGAGCLQHTDLWQNLKLLQGEREVTGLTKMFAHLCGYITWSNKVQHNISNSNQAAVKWHKCLKTRPKMSCLLW